MRTFGTYGPVNPEDNYVVSRSAELANFIARVKLGRYIVIFAPRQTGKTTFFQWAIEALIDDEIDTFFPIELNFEVYDGYSADDFYTSLYEDISEEVKDVFRKNGYEPYETLCQFLKDASLTDHVSMLRFFQELSEFLEDKHLVLIIDEFDGIPPDAVNGFLHAMRTIYVQRTMRKCPYSLGIVGVKSITQLNLNRSISPFNIQDEFTLPNFTLEQVDELFAQYTDEAGQIFAHEVIENIYRQTAGQPFLVNRFGQILTEEMNIPKSETITMSHFSQAHIKIREEDNTNLTHLMTNIRRDQRYKDLLMRIVSYERGVRFNPRREIVSELTTLGVIGKGTDGMCQIVNPIYHYCILHAFKPEINGLEQDYLPEDSDFLDYVTPSGQINMELLLDNFQNFISRVGFRILQLPETPKEHVGQDLLYAYLDQFVSLIRGAMFLEAHTGRGRMDMIIVHNGHKYIVETKIWEGERRYDAGKKQLSAYLRLERVNEGYYVVFDHRAEPQTRLETETIDGLTIRNYVIPVVQEVPTEQK